MSNLSQKYTLSLPTEIYEELKLVADKHDTSIKDVVRQCLKFGLIAMKLDNDPNSAIIFREQIKKGENQTEYNETQIKFMF